MKKYRLLLSLIAITVIGITFYACRKDYNEVDSSNKIEAVSKKQAQEIFGYAENEIRVRFKKKYTGLAPQWNLAVAQSLGVKHNVLYIPLAYDEPTGNYLHLVVMKDEGRVRSLLVEMQPDPSWRAGGKSIPEYKGLTGKLVFYSINGKFYHGYLMDNGAKQSEYVPADELKNVNVLMGTNTPMSATTTSGSDPCTYGTFGCQELAEVIVVARPANQTNYVYIYIPSTVYNSNPNGGSYNGYNWYPSGGGGGGAPPPPPQQDPCSAAQTGSVNATNFSANSKYVSARNSLVSAASDGKEHGISFGKDANGNIITSSVTTGTDHSSTTGSVTNRFADMHTHPVNTPPSSGDLYGFIDLAKNNSSYQRFIVTANGTVYALVVTNAQQMTAFNTKYPRVANPGYEPGFPGSLGDEYADISEREFGLYNKSRQESDEIAISYVLSAYNTGVALLKMNSNGTFKRIDATYKASTTDNPYILISC